MNGIKTRYSSSALLKKAQTWRTSPSWEPAKGMGAVDFKAFSLSARLGGT
jgi:hypothetical protein